MTFLHHPLVFEKDHFLVLFFMNIFAFVHLKRYICFIYWIMYHKVEWMMLN